MTLSSLKSETREPWKKIQFLCVTPRVLIGYHFLEKILNLGVWKNMCLEVRATTLKVFLKIFPEKQILYFAVSKQWKQTTYAPGTMTHNNLKKLCNFLAKPDMNYFVKLRWNRNWQGKVKTIQFKHMSMNFEEG